MDIKAHEITVEELANGYVDNKDGGVVAYGGKLNVRPAYQREFIYSPDMQKAVINTIMNNFPLNVMYWVDKEDGTYEMLDGQQRTISICSYMKNEYSVMRGNYPSTYDGLPDNVKKQLKEYKLTIYFCKGTAEEQLDWFRVINIAGLKLKDQELRNAIYTGTWLSDAKRYFSKKDCPAYKESKDYINAELDRQGYLEKALDWYTNYLGDKSDKRIDQYMNVHRFDKNANDLWLYYMSVFTWVKTIFPNYRAKMKGLPWGLYYNQYHNNAYDAVTLEEELKKLIKDVDVTNKAGIYHYLLSGNEKYLNIRAFDDDMKAWAYENQNGICPICGKHFEIYEMEADHITPWHLGGKTKAENCQMLCRDCNRHKGGK